LNTPKEQEHHTRATFQGLKPKIASKVRWERCEGEFGEEVLDLSVTFSRLYLGEHKLCTSMGIFVCVCGSFGYKVFE